MEFKDWSIIIGWVVVFFFGILSGGVVIPYLTRKRTILAWAVVSETELVPRELSQTLGVPVVIKVGEAQPASLASVTIRLGSAGNEPIKDLDVAIRFGKAAKILNVRSSSEFGEYGKFVRRKLEDEGYRVEADFLNPKHYFELEFLLSDYETGSVDVDSSAQGLYLKRSDPSRWELSSSLLKSIRFSFLGMVDYEPSANSMAQIAEELKTIRRHLSRN